MRSPLVRKIVGVPRMLCFWASARTFSMGASQVPAAGTMPFTMRSLQALARSAAHHTAFDFSAESRDRMGKRKV